MPLPIDSKKSLPISLSLRFRDMIWGLVISKFDKRGMICLSLIVLDCRFIMEIKEFLDSDMPSMMALKP